MTEMPSQDSHEPRDNKIISQEEFRRSIVLVRRRSERSGDPFLLLLIEGDSDLPKALSCLAKLTREIDAVGWYTHGKIGGVVFSQIASDHPSVISAIIRRVVENLFKELGGGKFGDLKLTQHVFPQKWQGDNQESQLPSPLYPDLIMKESALKRLTDIIGSGLILIVVAPLLGLVASVIKLTSKGPVLYRQRRVGHYGQTFTMLKFRSMHENNDSSGHEKYSCDLIAGRAKPQVSKETGSVVYKQTEDARVTAIGRFLRRTSLDELPQFVNVLKGEMSLVGPRPAIGYEVDVYETWHRRRLIEAKPGITGLWQVKARSRVNFDDMVRLDLRYAREWTPLMDIEILLRTPSAMMDGAH